MFCLVSDRYLIERKIRSKPKSANGDLPDTLGGDVVHTRRQQTEEVTIAIRGDIVMDVTHVNHSPRQWYLRFRVKDETANAMHDLNFNARASSSTQTGVHLLG